MNENKYIHVFYRHTSHNKPNPHRPKWFDYEKCFTNLIKTGNPDFFNLTIMYDGNSTGDFVHKYNHPVIEFQGGSDIESSKATFHYINSLDLNPNTIIYVLENDYLHRPGWCEALMLLYKRFRWNKDIYCSLFDHNDKYIFTNSEAKDHWGMYKDLKSKIITTLNSHWREVPNTCGTFSCLFKTVKEDFDIHTSNNADNTRFGQLTEERSRRVFTPIPGFSTHCQLPFMSPVINWEYISEHYS